MPCALGSFPGASPLDVHFTGQGCRSGAAFLRPGVRPGAGQGLLFCALACAHLCTWPGSRRLRIGSPERSARPGDRPGKSSARGRACLSTRAWARAASMGRLGAVRAASRDPPARVARRGGLRSLRSSARPLCCPRGPSEGGRRRPLPRTPRRQFSHKRPLRRPAPRGVAVPGPVVSAPVGSLHLAWGASLQGGGRPRVPSSVGSVPARWVTERPASCVGSLVWGLRAVHLSRRGMRLRTAPRFQVPGRSGRPAGGGGCG